MAKYPDEAYNPVMEVYGKLPSDLKPKANAIMGEYAKKYPQGEAPPHMMKRDLEALLHQPAAAHAAESHSGHKETIDEKVGGGGKYLAGVGSAIENVYNSIGSAISHVSEYLGKLVDYMSNPLVAAGVAALLVIAYL